MHRHQDRRWYQFRNNPIVRRYHHQRHTNHRRHLRHHRYLLYC